MTAVWALVGLLAACLPHAPPAVPVGHDRVALEVDLVETFLGQERPDLALALLRQLRQDGHPTWEVDLYHARALALQGMTATAAERLARLAEERPRDPRPWRHLGLLQAASGEAAEALESLRRAVTLAPDHAPTWNNLGFVLLTAGRYREAIEALEAAIDLDGTPSRYRNNLGYALAGVGDLERALETFATTSDAAPPEHRLGLSLERLGAADQARDHYRRALLSHPDHEPTRAALERLTPSPESP